MMKKMLCSILCLTLLFDFPASFWPSGAEALLITELPKQKLKEASELRRETESLTQELQDLKKRRSQREEERAPTEEIKKIDEAIAATQAALKESRPAERGAAFSEAKSKIKAAKAPAEKEELPPPAPFAPEFLEAEKVQEVLKTEAPFPSLWSPENWDEVFDLCEAPETKAPAFDLKETTWTYGLGEAATGEAIIEFDVGPFIQAWLEDQRREFEEGQSPGYRTAPPCLSFGLRAVPIWRNELLKLGGGLPEFEMSALSDVEKTAIQYKGYESPSASYCRDYYIIDPQRLCPPLPFAPQYGGFGRTVDERIQISKVTVVDPESSNKTYSIEEYPGIRNPYGWFPDIPLSPTATTVRVVVRLKEPIQKMRRIQEILPFAQVQKWFDDVFGALVASPDHIDAAIKQMDKKFKKQAKAEGQEKKDAAIKSLEEEEIYLCRGLKYGPQQGLAFEQQERKCSWLAEELENLKKQGPELFAANHKIRQLAWFKQYLNTNVPVFGFPPSLADTLIVLDGPKSGTNIVARSEKEFCAGSSREVTISSPDAVDLSDWWQDAFLAWSEPIIPSLARIRVPQAAIVKHTLTGGCPHSYVTLFGLEFREASYQIRRIYEDTAGKAVGDGSTLCLPAAYGIPDLWAEYWTTWWATRRPPADAPQRNLTLLRCFEERPWAVFMPLYHYAKRGEGHYENAVSEWKPGKTYDFRKTYRLACSFPAGPPAAELKPPTEIKAGELPPPPVELTWLGQIVEGDEPVYPGGRSKIVIHIESWTIGDPAEKRPVTLFLKTKDPSAKGIFQIIRAKTLDLERATSTHFDTQAEQATVTFRPARDTIELVLQMNAPKGELPAGESKFFDAEIWASASAEKEVMTVRAEVRQSCDAVGSSEAALVEKRFSTTPLFKEEAFFGWGPIYSNLINKMSTNIRCLLENGELKQKSPAIHARLADYQREVRDWGARFETLREKAPPLVRSLTRICNEFPKDLDPGIAEARRQVYITNHETMEVSDSWRRMILSTTRPPIEKELEKHWNARDLHKTLGTRAFPGAPFDEADYFDFDHTDITTAEQGAYYEEFFSADVPDIMETLPSMSVAVERLLRETKWPSEEKLTFAEADEFEKLAAALGTAKWTPGPAGGIPSLTSGGGEETLLKRAESTTEAFLKLLQQQNIPLPEPGSSAALAIATPLPREVVEGLQILAEQMKVFHSHLFISVAFGVHVNFARSAKALGSQCPPMWVAAILYHYLTRIFLPSFSSKIQGLIQGLEPDRFEGMYGSEDTHPRAIYGALSYILNDFVKVLNLPESTT